MKSPKILAAAVASVAAVALAGGLAYAMEPIDPTTLPLPDKAQDTSIAKQVASIIVYEDQEEAVAMATEFDEIHDELALEAVASRANIAKAHREMQSAAVEAAEQTGSTGAAAGGGQTPPKGSDEKGAVEAVDVTEPLKSISPDQGSAAAMKPATIDVNGDVMDYVDSFESASAPTTGAGLWMGSDSTTDNSWGYFIGHNPGSFTCVMTLKNGDPVTVCDGDGNRRTYEVVDEFIVPDDTYWEDIRSRVTDYGESIILQTCCGDNAHYRVVIAC
ncbi:hypothetical protein AALA69_05125 [Eggerthellaceae bacterium 24-137]